MSPPRSILLGFTAFAMITSMILITTHSSPSCTYAPEGTSMKNCDTNHLAHCKGPAYFFRETYVDSNNATVHRELSCPWSENVPLMSYFAMGFTLFAVVLFGMVLKGFCPKCVLTAFSIGLVSMMLLGVTMLLMYADAMMGMRIYVDPVQGNYASHNMFFFTLGLVAFVFVSMTIFTVKTYKGYSSEVKPSMLLLETRTGGTMGDYQA